MRYKHRIIDASDVLKLIDKESSDWHNDYLDKNTVNWARNCICQIPTKEENKTKLICEFQYGVPMYFCKHCGSPIRSILDNYCSNCGYKIINQ